jgi:hypothetical protein
VPWSTISRGGWIKLSTRKSIPVLFKKEISCSSMVLYFQAHSRGKWMLSYEGPCIVKMFFSSGAMTLTIMNDVELPHPVNTDAVKKYFV